MLHAGGFQPVKQTLLLLAVFVEILDPNHRRAFHICELFGNAQTPLFVAGKLLGDTGDFWIDDFDRSGRFLVIARAAVHDKHAMQRANLVGRQANARGVIHGFEHVIEQSAQLVRHVFNRFCLSLERRVRRDENGQNSHSSLTSSREITLSL